jgi:hypothetical protein
MNIQLKNAPTEGTRHGDPRLAVTYRPIAELKLDPRNPRCHAPKQIRQIAQSLTAFGSRPDPGVPAAGLERSSDHLFRASKRCPGQGLYDRREPPD